MIYLKAKGRINMLRFSVLMSVYKNEKPEYLKQAIESMINQTLMPNEIVIVKDGLLTYELNQVIEDYQNSYEGLFNVIAFEENMGLGLALRDGVLACNCEYIARMDTDDISKLDRFEKQIDFLEKHKEISLLGSCIEEFKDDINEVDRILILPQEHKEIINFAKSRNPFKHNTVVFKKSAALKCGNYRDFCWFEDYDLWVRMIQAGYQTSNLQEALVFTRVNDELFARRGGTQYLKREWEFQLYLFKIGFIGFYHLVKNILIRSVVRLLPIRVRSLFYRCFLRSGK